MIIDAHQHFWHLSRNDYEWLTPAQGVLYRDYLPKDLAPLLIDNDVSATVLVQAAGNEAETRYLFELAQAHAFISGVVGWVDFESAHAPSRIAALVADGRGKLKGLRPMIQDIADPNWILKPALDAAFESLIVHGLVFDALVRPPQLEALRRRLMRHPVLRAVLDHAGKPAIVNRDFDAWAADLEQLARDTSVYCKLSGILTEAGVGATKEDLAPYIAHVFRCFGPERVLWGSDWPVVNLAGNYARWLALSRGFIDRFAPGREQEVFGDAAVRLYQLEVP
jgi:L-fucono-1,5-lactonase